jgi:hypothetical protein
MVPGATAKVAVTRFEAPRHLAFDWDDTMHVDMSFEPSETARTQATVRVNGSKAPMRWRRPPIQSRGLPSCCATSRPLLETGDRQIWCGTRPRS